MLTITAVLSQQIELIARNCKIALIPTKWAEPFGKVFVEALSRGQFIISTNYGIAKNVIEDGLNGYIIQNDFGDLAQKVRASTEINTESICEISQRKWAANYSIETWTQAWGEFYEI